MAHADQQEANELERDVRLYPLTWRFVVERVTGIEPALSAWEVCGGSVCHQLIP